MTPQIENVRPAGVIAVLYLSDTFPMVLLKTPSKIDLWLKLTAD